MLAEPLPKADIWNLHWLNLCVRELGGVCTLAEAEWVRLPDHKEAWMGALRKLRAQATGELKRIRSLRDSTVDVVGLEYARLLRFEGQERRFLDTISERLVMLTPGFPHPIFVISPLDGEVLLQRDRLLHENDQLRAQIQGTVRVEKLQSDLVGARAKITRLELQLANRQTKVG